MKKHKVLDTDLQTLDAILKERGIITDDPNEAAKTVINYDGTKISLENALSLFEKPEEDNNFLQE